VKLIAARFVKPYVKSNKNDSVDAKGKGCAWAVRRQSLACFDELIGLGEVQKVRDEILKPA